MKKILSFLMVATMALAIPMAASAATTSVTVTGHCEADEATNTWTDVEAVYDESTGKYTVTAPDWEGYGFADAADSTQSSESAPSSVTFEYSKIVNYTITYTDEDGNVLKDAETKEDYCGQYVTETAPEIDGYTPLESSSGLELGVTEADNEIAFVYAQDSDSDSTTTDSDDEDDDTTSSSSSSSEPKTGDEGMIIFYSILGLITLAGAGTYAYKKTR